MLFDRLGRAWNELRDKLSHLRAIVVDDEEVVCMVLREVLEGEGFEVETVGTAEAAWKLIGEKPFDLLVTDKNLPGMSGIELISLAYTDKPELPSVIITGYASIHSVGRAFEFGAVDYISKPFEEVGHVARRLKSVAERSVAQRIYQQITADLKTAMDDNGTDPNALAGLARDLKNFKAALQKRADVLILEPDHHVAERIAAELRMRDLAVMAAQTKEDAMARLASEDAPMVSLVSLDIPHPATFIWDLRSSDPLSEVLVLRDNAALPATLAAIEAGAADFVDLEHEGMPVLQARVARLTDNARKQRLHIYLIAALYQRVRDKDPFTAEVLLSVVPGDQRRYLERVSADNHLGISLFGDPSTPQQ